jgi:hypothetical protein
MKRIQTGTLKDCNARIEALKAQGIYSCLSGSEKTGYEVLVRDAVAGTLQTDGPIPETNGGGKAA